jgi:hypothetical protein
VAARRAAAAQFATFRESGFGYFLEMATRPQTIGYALLDSPVALAAWMLDHETDSHEKISRAFVDGEPAGNLTRDHILDNITLYWADGDRRLGGPVVLGGRKALAQAHASGQSPPDVPLPVGFTTFPGEIWRTPRSWVENSCPNVAYSTRSTEAATSPRGKSPSCSRARFARRSGRCGRSTNPEPTPPPARRRRGTHGSGDAASARRHGVD